MSRLAGRTDTYLCDVCGRQFARSFGHIVDRVELITPCLRMWDMCPSCAAVVRAFVERMRSEAEEQNKRTVRRLLGGKS